jgi:tetratricopeptide (TPR) repeat protein
VKAGGAGASRGRRGTALAALASLLLAGVVQGRIEARGAGRNEIHPLLYLPSGRYLKAAALGYDGLLADLIYLWSIQYYGNYEIADRYRYLEQIYGRVIAELDPHYLDPYLVGALIMSAEARDPEMALRLLDKGIANNPDQWILAFEAGFLCYDTLHDYLRAARYFEKALDTPGVHPLVRRLYAEMYDRAGDKRTSLKEWAEIEATSKDDYVRNVAWNHVHDLKVDVDLADLSGAVGAFTRSEGRPPRSLEELRARGLASEIPRDPEDRDYLYDPSTGKVAYRGSLILSRPGG